MKKFIVGAVIGTVVGGIAALLSTPKSGKEVRDELNKNYTKVKEKTTEAYASVKEKLDQAKNKQENEDVSEVNEALDSNASAEANEEEKITVSIVSEKNEETSNNK